MLLVSVDSGGKPTCGMIHEVLRLDTFTGLYDNRKEFATRLPFDPNGMVTVVTHRDLITQQEYIYNDTKLLANNFLKATQFSSHGSILSRRENVQTTG